jgi:hypothetical protein
MPDGNLLAVFLEHDGAAGEPFEAADLLALVDAHPDKLRSDLAPGDKDDFEVLPRPGTIERYGFFCRRHFNILADFTAHPQ